MTPLNHALQRAVAGRRGCRQRLVAAFLARRTEAGMEPDDLLCSRNAHDRNVLVRRAQSRINLATLEVK
jgi:hypothetical protein